MVWLRRTARPTRRVPVKVQNEPLPGAFLRAGTLVRAIVPLSLTNTRWGTEVQGIRALYDSLVTGIVPIIERGDFAIYIGRLVQDGKYTQHFQFLHSRGIFIVAPDYFKDARDGENS